MFRRVTAGYAAAALALVLVVGGGGGASAHAEPQRIGFPYPFSKEHAPGDRYMGLRLNGVLKLEPVSREGGTLAGISALAWDDDEQRLYALSDNGVLFHLSLGFDDHTLTGAWLEAVYPLRDGRGRELRGRMADSESLVALNARNGVRGDTQLAMSFERAHRIARYTPQGTLVGGVALPGVLRDPSRYQSSNRSLESLALHPELGYLTAPELPFKDVTDGHVELHAVERRRFWRYPLAPEPNAGLTAMEALPDGSLLTLERGYGELSVPVITTLRRVRELPATTGALLQVDTVARFSTGEGWSLDNFEGLTLQRGNRILVVSDDNGRGFQVTLLAAFELLDRHAAGAGPDRPGTPGRDLTGFRETRAVNRIK